MSRHPNPFRLHTLCSFLGCWLAVSAAFSQEPGFKKTTHVYKTVGEVKIEADIYRSDDAVMRPTVVWIHGGALIVGSREGVPGDILDLCKREGFALISIDYRLAPEVKLPEIVEDLDDAMKWVQQQGPKLLGIDPDRMVITGGSAGGLCTYIVASRMSPKPRAIVSYWGYGDFDPDWTTIHSTNHGEPLSREEALKGVNHGIVTAPTKEQSAARSKFYLYSRQNGIWAKEVTGFDPVDEKSEIDKYAPVMTIKSDFPHTLMIHGTIDTDVPYTCSLKMVEALNKQGVNYELATVENAGHGLSGGDPQRTQAARERALSFIRSHLK